MARTHQLLTVAEASDLLDVNVKTLRNQLRQTNGRIGDVTIAVRIGGIWRCLPEAIERLKRGEHDDEKAA